MWESFGITFVQTGPTEWVSENNEVTVKVVMGESIFVRAGALCLTKTIRHAFGVVDIAETLERTLRIFFFDREYFNCDIEVEDLLAPVDTPQ